MVGLFLKNSCPLQNAVCTRCEEKDSLERKEESRRLKQKKDDVKSAPHGKRSPAHPLDSFIPTAFISMQPLQNQ